MPYDSELAGVLLRGRYVPPRDDAMIDAYNLGMVRAAELIRANPDLGEFGLQALIDAQMIEAREMLRKVPA